MTKPTKCADESDSTFVTFDTSVDASIEQKRNAQPESGLTAKNFAYDVHPKCDANVWIPKDTYERIITM